MRLRAGVGERAPHAPSTLTPRHAHTSLLPVVIVAGLLGASVPGSVHAMPAPLDCHGLIASAPADCFMQAVVRQNGGLAWQQLCPALQQKIPAAELANLTNALSAGRSEQGEQLGLDYVGAHIWAAGGQVRVYVVTARWPSGDDARALYVLRTQASGCIDGVLVA